MSDIPQLPQSNILAIVFLCAIAIGIIWFIVSRFIKIKERRSVGFALGKVALEVITFPPILFIVLFLPALGLNKLTDGWLNDHMLLSGGVFLLLFVGIQAALIIYHSSEKNKDL